MQIVIDISNTLKQIADEEDTKTFSNIVWQAILMDAIKNGIVLPEKHGRLIDADELENKVCTYCETGCGSCDYQIICPCDAPTILEGTKESTDADSD